MAGERNLEKLLSSMSAELLDGLYVFATVPDGVLPSGLRPRMLFHEAEGMTLILLKEEAEAHGLEFEFPCRMITLNIHSSLEAVGFLARITTALAAHDMGVNPVSGYFHDHLFVPDGRELDAIAVLDGFTAKS
ncbi:ACT domain-containing protein [Aliiroseovarius sp. Z3]|uniref:ACT domain-containing protein n=1 Tax=Aliiroseovarius sp. Z3 TaxID=2811402 RepID=UPI0023B27979|nr:ACT domain-containing protein [Aliiroseovarius sp. Z3]MDE9449794.1 ACT domain-containing protein [Aliiroseovarius sp. Z3]